MPTGPAPVGLHVVIHTWVSTNGFVWVGGGLVTGLIVAFGQGVAQAA
ncbi:hypothetical protein ACWGLO_20140 [Streptomyces niveus]